MQKGLSAVERNEGVVGRGSKGGGTEVAKRKNSGTGSKRFKGRTLKCL